MKAEPEKESENGRVDLVLPYKFGIVVADFDASDYGDGCLDLRKGDIVKFVKEEAGWWFGRCVDTLDPSGELADGWYPRAFTKSQDELAVWV